MKCKDLINDRQVLFANLQSVCHDEIDVPPPGIIPFRAYVVSEFQKHLKVLLPLFYLLSCCIT